MKEKPIIFSTEMVKAIIAGNKTQTRRVIKNKTGICDKCFNDGIIHNGKDAIGDICYLRIAYCEENQMMGLRLRPPYEIGQTLWVRETFVFNDNPDSKEYNKYEYKVDYEGALCQDLITWKPSIFMPRKAARLFLKITDIRIERIQDISAPDAYHEGVRCNCMSPVPACKGNIETFQKLWDSINKKRGYGWDENPYVWVYDFEVIK